MADPEINQEISAPVNESENKKEELFQRMIQLQKRLSKADTEFLRLKDDFERLKEEPDHFAEEKAILGQISQSMVNSVKECMMKLDNTLDRFLQETGYSAPTVGGKEIDSEKGDPVDSGDIKNTSIEGLHGEASGTKD